MTYFRYRLCFNNITRLIFTSFCFSCWYLNWIVPIRHNNHNWARPLALKPISEELLMVGCGWLVGNLMIVHCNGFSTIIMLITICSHMSRIHWKTSLVTCIFQTDNNFNRISSSLKAWRKQCKTEATRLVCVIVGGKARYSPAPHDDAQLWSFACFAAAEIVWAELTLLRGLCIFMCSSSVRHTTISWFYADFLHVYYGECHANARANSSPRWPPERKGSVSVRMYDQIRASLLNHIWIYPAMA